MFCLLSIIIMLCFLALSMRVVLDLVDITEDYSARSVILKPDITEGYSARSVILKPDIRASVGVDNIIYVQVFIYLDGTIYFRKKHTHYVFYSEVYLCWRCMHRVGEHSVLRVWFSDTNLNVQELASLE